jgi:deoxycytidylate deaminase
MFKIDNNESFVSKKDRKFIEEAIQIASNSPCYSQHGCVLVRNGKIIGRGYNYHFQSESCQTIHAEVDALMQCLKRKRLERYYFQD